MGDLDHDSAVTDSVGVVTPAWDGFGPNGGFLSTMSMRAALGSARVDVVRSVQSQFVRPARHTGLSFTTTVLGRSNRSDTVQTVGTQEGGPVLVTLVRTLQPVPGEIDRENSAFPEVPDPDFLQPTERLLPPEAVGVVPMTRHFEVRPVTWERTWPPVKARPPRCLVWCRFRPRAVFADAAVNTGRFLVLLDSCVWNAVERGTSGATGLSPRSTDLSVTVLDSGSAEEWLLCDVTVPLIRAGSAAAVGAVWSRTGQLLATGSMNMTLVRTRG
ncbi:thioesterase family protein [Streptomyces albus subsp. chlorinus]|uniref:thioesterase family protein n=1 Tax=Streptomyces albus TaxID=1888 RepID=UPI00156DE6DF|nr:thioesterase family protein [Streptomyces albus]NSC25212.1 thioesterase family protein [Streptomyces albus subsp. chlorinus]